jgi:hypothetical protein
MLQVKSIPASRLSSVPAFYFTRRHSHFRLPATRHALCSEPLLPTSTFPLPPSHLPTFSSSHPLNFCLFRLPHIPHSHFPLPTSALSTSQLLTFCPPHYAPCPPPYAVSSDFPPGRRPLCPLRAGGRIPTSHFRPLTLSPSHLLSFPTSQILYRQYQYGYL